MLRVFTDYRLKRSNQAAVVYRTKMITRGFDKSGSGKSWGAIMMWRDTELEIKISYITNLYHLPCKSQGAESTQKVLFCH